MRHHTETGSGQIILNSVEQTCARLALGRTSVYSLLKANELMAVKFGKATRITEESIQGLLAKRLAAARTKV